MNCKVFVEAAIIEPIITHAYAYSVITVYHQNMEVSAPLNISFLLKKFLLTWTSKCLWKQSSFRWAYNHVDASEIFQQSIFQQSILSVEESSFKVEVTE